jgi:hypothetical protein
MGGIQLDTHFFCPKKAIGGSSNVAVTSRRWTQFNLM